MGVPRCRHVWLLSAAVALAVAVEGYYWCPSGWTVVETKCLLPSDLLLERYEAIKICKEEKNATLWLPVNALENNALLNPNVSSMNGYYWLSIYYDISTEQWYRPTGKIWNRTASYERLGRYSFYDHKAEPCAVWNRRYGGWTIRKCSRPAHFICERPSRCADGYYGARCERECHCFRETCSSTGVCRLGCEGGWAGSNCDVEKKKVEALYYCLDIPAEGKQMLLRANTHGMNFSEISAVDRGGNPLTSCNMTSLMYNINGALELRIRLQDGAFIPACGDFMVANDTWSWTFRFSEFPWTLSAYDAVFEVTCNFSAADTMQRSSDVQSGGHRAARSIAGVRNVRKRAETQRLQESHLAVDLKLTDASTDEEVTSARIGQHLQLHLDFHEGEEYGARLIEPFSCDVSTADGEIRVPFLGYDGCPVPNARILLIQGNGTHWQSEVFETFAFSGHDHVIFSCHFHVCFTTDSDSCSDRCQKSKVFPYQYRLRNPSSTRAVKGRSLGLRLAILPN